MKKILFSLFLILILTSCSKQKKETALEKCADYYFLSSSERLFSIDVNHKKNNNYILVNKNLKDLNFELKKNDDVSNIIFSKHLNNAPKQPWITEVGDLSKYKVLFKEYEVARKLHEKLENDLMIPFAKKRKSLKRKIKNTEIERRRIIFNLVNKKFRTLKLKGKSNIPLYIKKYTKCENDYNKTPSAFLLEWRNN